MIANSLGKKFINIVNLFDNSMLSIFRHFSYKLLNVTNTQIYVITFYK